VHLVRRNSDDATLQIKIADGEFRPCTEDEVRGLFPIQAYSQKQLSDISVRLEELSRFVTAPIRTRLNQVQRSLEEKAARVRQTHAVRKRQMVLTANLGQRELEATSLAQQAETLKNSLTGLSQEDRALLDRGKTWQSADEAVQAWKSEIQYLKDG